MGYEPKEIIERNKPLLIEEHLVLRLPNKFLYARPDIIYRNDKELILTDYKVYKFKPSEHKLQELIDVILLYVFIYNNTFKRNISKAQIRLLNQREDIIIDISEERIQKLLKKIKL